MRLAALALFILAVAEARGVAAQDSTARAAQALQRPLSPGAVALLAEHATDPAVQKRLTEALRHTDPAIRIVAARLAFVTVSKAQTPHLVRALSVETDPDAATEQVRALLGLLGQSADDLVMGEVTRLGGMGAQAVADHWARARPLTLVERLTALRTLPHDASLGDALAVAAAQHPDAAGALSNAVLDAEDVWLWYAFVNGVRENGGSINESALLRALGSTSGRLREVTLWALAYAAADGEPIAPAVREAARGRGADTDLTWERFGAELLARVLGAQPAPLDWVGLMRREYAEHGVSVSLFPWLTKGELAIVSAARGDRQAATLQQTMRQGREGLRERVSRLNRLRTLESLSPGFIADLVSVTGCKPMGGGWFAAAELAYQADGRPRAAMVMDENLSRACQAAIRAGVALTVPADGRAVSTEARDIVVLLFDPQLIACAAQPAGPRPPQTPAGGKGVSTLARPTWREPFTYPRAAQKSGVSGAVLVDVTMNHNGCVTSARTRRGLGPIIDLAVVQSAARWKFTPPTFNATPVAGGFTIVYDVEPPQWR